MIVEKVTEVVKFCDHYGDNFETQLTLQWITPTTVYIRNLSGSFTKTMRTELEEYLLAQGVQRATYYRLQHGRLVPFEVEFKGKKSPSRQVIQ